MMPTSLHAIEPNLPQISYVSFPSLDPAAPLTVAAQLRVPRDAPQPMPAVVIVHGTAGVDSRGSFYAAALNEAGIATLEIDMWAARGLGGGSAGRPPGVVETLPDAYGALAFLSGHPRIDAGRIGILGFSWGGIVSLLTATARYTSQHVGTSASFAAHVANYPVCWTYSRVRAHALDELTGSPVLIQAGELDSYDEPDTCAKLVESLRKDFVSLCTYPNATHAWDRLEPAVTVSDPYAHLGQGGPVEFVPNPQAASESRAAALRFFQEAFGKVPAGNRSTRGLSR
jgi:uncharacterized protein